MLTRVRPKAEDMSGEAARKKLLAQSALIYVARWTLTLSLICQSKPRSRDCLILKLIQNKLIIKGGATRSGPKSHIIFGKTRCSLKIIANLVTVQFSIIYVASV